MNLGGGGDGMKSEGVCGQMNVSPSTQSVIKI